MKTRELYLKPYVGAVYRKGPHVQKLVQRYLINIPLNLSN